MRRAAERGESESSGRLYADYRYVVDERYVDLMSRKHDRPVDSASSETILLPSSFSRAS